MLCSFKTGSTWQWHFGITITLEEERGLVPPRAAQPGWARKPQILCPKPRSLSYPTISPWVYRMNACLEPTGRLPLHLFGAVASFLLSPVLLSLHGSIGRQAPVPKAALVGEAFMSRRHSCRPRSGPVKSAWFRLSLHCWGLRTSTCLSQSSQWPGLKDPPQEFRCGFVPDSPVLRSSGSGRSVERKCPISH